MLPVMGSPAWRGTADAWFKLLAAIAIGYVILGQAVALVKSFPDTSIIAAGGILLAYLVYPAVAWLNARLPLWAALSIVYVAGVLVILAILYLVVPVAVVQVRSFLGDLPTIQRSVIAFIHNPDNPLFSHLPSGAQQYFLKLPAEIATDLQHHASAYTGKVINAAKVLIAIGVVAIAIPVVSIYMLAESPMIKRFLLQCIKPRWRESAVAVLSDIDQVIGGFIRGQIIVAAVVGILAIIALVILHVRYAVIIGIWAGVTDIIPYIGPFAGAIPAVIVAAIFNGAGGVVGVIVAFIVINQLEGHLLGPRIVSSTVKITPLAVIFSLLICGKIFGFFGLIVAVPLAGIMRVTLVHLFRKDEVTGAGDG